MVKKIVLEKRNLTDLIRQKALEHKKQIEYVEISSNKITVVFKQDIPADVLKRLETHFQTYFKHWRIAGAE